MKEVDVIQSVSSITRYLCADLLTGYTAYPSTRTVRRDLRSDSSTMETRTAHVVVIINYYFLWYQENVLVLGRTQVAGRQPATTPPRCGAFWSVQFVTARGSCPMPGSATFFRLAWFRDSD